MQLKQREHTAITPSGSYTHPDGHLRGPFTQISLPSNRGDILILRATTPIVNRRKRITAERTVRGFRPLDPETRHVCVKSSQISEAGMTTTIDNRRYWTSVGISAVLTHVGGNVLPNCGGGSPGVTGAVPMRSTHVRELNFGQFWWNHRNVKARSPATRASPNLVRGTSALRPRRTRRRRGRRHLWSGDAITRTAPWRSAERRIRLGANVWLRTR